jgi:hypothetical protein
MQVFLLGDFFLATNSQKIWLPHVPLETTVKNKVLAGIFPLGTSFLAIISRGTRENLIYCPYFYW